MMNRKVTIRYKNIKNMYMRMDENGDLIITCPPRVKESQIQKFLDEKATWISRMDQKRKERKIQHLDLTGRESDSATMLGKKYRVVKRTGARNEIHVGEDSIIYELKDQDSAVIDSLFYQYAAEQMAVILRKMREVYDMKICKTNQLPYPALSLRYMKTRWGSCTPKTCRIRMNVRLYHYPIECMRAVLLHEYAHLLVPNHSKAFYDVVEGIMPEYRRYDKLLK